MKESPNSNTSSYSTFSFVALQCSFEILKTWIKYAKDRKSKFDLQKMWNDPQK
jgi:hypothetical protein